MASFKQSADLASLPSELKLMLLEASALTGSPQSFVSLGSLNREFRCIYKGHADRLLDDLAESTLQRFKPLAIYLSFLHDKSTEAQNAISDIEHAARHGEKDAADKMAQMLEAASKDRLRSAISMHLTICSLARLGREYKPTLERKQRVRRVPGFDTWIKAGYLYATRSESSSLKTVSPKIPDTEHWDLSTARDRKIQRPLRDRCEDITKAIGTAFLQRFDALNKKEFVEKALAKIASESSAMAERYYDAFHQSITYSTASCPELATFSASNKLVREFFQGSNTGNDTEWFQKGIMAEFDERLSKWIPDRSGTYRYGSYWY